MWGWLSAKLAGLLKGTYRAIKIARQSMDHLYKNSGHLWSKVLYNVTRNNVKNPVYKAVRKGDWNVMNNGDIKDEL